MRRITQCTDDGLVYCLFCFELVWGRVDDEVKRKVMLYLRKKKKNTGKVVIQMSSMCEEKSTFDCER